MMNSFNVTGAVAAMLCKHCPAMNSHGNAKG
jgi:hypothetical protein